jgi:hypothetical protein
MQWRREKSLPLLGFKLRSSCRGPVSILTELPRLRERRRKKLKRKGIRKTRRKKGTKTGEKEGNA